MKPRSWRNDLLVWCVLGSLVPGCTSDGLFFPLETDDGVFAGGNGSPSPSQSTSPSASPTQNASPSSSGPSGNGSLALSGIIRVPSLNLISNNSGALITDQGASLTDTGGGAFYRILAIAANPFSGAKVSLVDINGRLASDQQIMTDAQGRFTFSQVATSSEPLFVTADFQGNGKEFSFRTLLPALSSAASVDLDVASTLVAEKLRASIAKGLVPPRGLESQKLQALVEEVRTRLIPEQVPFMARNSRDLVPAVDQLMLDQPDVAKAAAGIATPLSAPVDSWQVSKLFSYSELKAKNVVPVSDVLLPAVDADGNLYVAKNGWNNSCVLYKVTPSGAVSDLGVIPFAGPYSPLVGPHGEIYVVGLEPATLRLRVALVGSEVRILPGYLYQVAPSETMPNLDMAVDAAGNLFASLTHKHAVVELASNSSTPVVVAGAMGQPGYVDGVGTQARFDSPRGLTRGLDGAIYVADHRNSCVRRIAADGTVSTFAGKPGETVPRFGRAAYSRFGNPDSIAMDAAGNFFVLDYGARRIMKISADGSVFLVAGSGQAQYADGLGNGASFLTPTRLRIDGKGRLYVKDMTGLMKPEGEDIIRLISMP